MARQLAAWTDLAFGWPCQDSGDGRVKLCKECGRGIYLLTDEQGKAYEYTLEQVLALAVLHLRNHHADLDPNV